MKIKGIVDRIESVFAVVELENGLIQNYELPEFPIQEGDSVVVVDHQIVSVDPNETEHRKLEIQELMDELFK